MTLFARRAKAHAARRSSRSACEASKLGTQAGTWLHNSADYIEQMEPEKIKADVTEQVRRNPGKSLLVAGAAGLILGAIFRRK